VTLVRDAGAQPIAQLSVPYKGTWPSLAAHQISNDALYMSENVFIRQGKLRERPGLSRHNDSTFDAPIIGGAMAVTPSGKVLIAISKSSCYEIAGFGTDPWAATSTGVYADNDNGIIDIAFIETSSQYVGLIASEGYALKKWQVGVGISAITASVGAVPTAKSVCVASRRVVCLVPPHTLVWSTIFDYTSWPALATTKVAATNDAGICVKTLSNLSFVLYKERSIYLARAQAGTDATAFSLNEPIIVEGPAGVHAVVEISGNHVYMTKSGRIALFDGSQYPKWIADGIWLFLQADIDPAYTYKIFAVYDYRLHSILFFYPRLGDSGQLRGLVLLSFPLEGSGVVQGMPTVQGPAAFLGSTSQWCSYGYTIHLNNQIDTSFMFGAQSLRSYLFDENVRTDDGNSFTSQFQTGLVPLPDMKHTFVSLETFIERSNGYGTVTVEGVYSDSLENAGGAIDGSNPLTVDLNNAPVQSYEGFTVPTRFFGLRFTWLSADTVRYAGTTLYGRAVT
jgi:hypothetical protein